MRATAQLTFEKVRHDQEKDVHLVLTLTAPGEDSGSRRPPVCVIPVIDVSGSMVGAKLHYAKQSVMKLVDHLAPGDFCGIVAFSTEVATLAPPREVTQARKDELKAAVGRLAPQQNTNLAGGMLKGLEHARARLPEGVRARVVLFTDGLANEGPATTAADIVRLLEANLGAATLSAFGYGRDADQDLLRELSTAGKGNYAFVASPEDALTAFARELGGLLSTYARDIEVRVSPRGTHRITEVVSDVDANELVGAVRLRIPDLLAGEARQIVLGMRLAAQPGPRDAAVTVATIDVACETFREGRPVRSQVACEASVRSVAPGDEQERPTAEVDLAVATAQLVRAQIEAEEAARHGRYAEAHAALYQMASSVDARGHAPVATAGRKLAESMRDQAAYARSAAYRSSMRKGASRNVGSSWQQEAQADLAAMGKGIDTAQQSRMVESFGEDEEKGQDAAGQQERPLAKRRSKRW